MKPLLPRLLGPLILAAPLALAPPARAVSVYDVILLSQKGFSEPEIIRILDATESAFTVSADDVVRLKRLGVGETVIQRLLAATPEERPDWKPVGENAPRRAAPPVRSSADEGPRYHHDRYEQTDAHSVVLRPAPGGEGSDGAESREDSP